MPELWPDEERKPDEGQEESVPGRQLTALE